MPDHVRPHVDAMGPPRSPASLSLVIGKRDPDHELRNLHDELMIQMPGSPGRSSGFSESEDAPHYTHPNADVIVENVVMDDGDVTLHYVDPNVDVIVENVVMDDGEDGGALIVALEEEVIEQDEANLPVASATDKHSTSDDSGHGGEDVSNKTHESDAEQKSIGIGTCIGIGIGISRPWVNSDVLTVAAPCGIKVKDFARFATVHNDQPMDDNLLARGTSSDDVGDLKDDLDDDTDLSSNESWDTESMSMPEGVQRSYHCHYCEKVFTNRHHMMSHLVTHTGERNFNCRECGKSFGRKSTLRAHMTTHTGTSNFMCHICDKACNDNNSLEEHMRMHTGEKPFVCSICSKAYARKSHLNVHYRVHTGERPFVCQDCGEDFTEKRFLNDHLQTAHTGHDGPPKCPNCFREFKYKPSLREHLKRQLCVKNLIRGNKMQQPAGAGGLQKQYCCPFCEKSYSWKQTLKTHVSTYHQNKVHTDDFWKFELAKQRRNNPDGDNNEDMWQRQLGKHASSSTAGDSVTNRHGSMNESLLYDIDLGHEDKWLDQIKRTNQCQASNEMKRMAIRSLGSSIMYLNSNSNNRHPINDRMEEDEFMPTREDGYLALLANVSYNRMETEPNSSLNMIQSSAPQWEHLRNIKEEPAARRTQMWLAQLGRVEPEEVDRSQEERWEEQIARNKHQLVKSPLGGTNICEKNEPTLPIHHQMHHATTIMPMMIHHPQVTAPSHFLSGSPGRNASHQLTITLHTPDHESERQGLRRVPAFLADENNNNNDQNNNEPQVVRHIPLAPPPLPHRSLPIPIPRSIENSHQSHSPVAGTESVLKSLLLDPSSRKRLISSPSSLPVAPKSRFIHEETDILRRCLLGLKDPEPTIPKVCVPQPRFNPPTATITSQDVKDPAPYMKPTGSGTSSNMASTSPKKEEDSSLK